jgi:hypothetical protein
VSKKKNPVWWPLKMWYSVLHAWYLFQAVCWKQFVFVTYPHNQTFIEIFRPSYCELLSRIFDIVDNLRIRLLLMEEYIRELYKWVYFSPSKWQ